MCHQKVHNGEQAREVLNHQKSHNGARANAK
jgi:hypothetical protein